MASSAATISIMSVNGPETVKPKTTTMSSVQKSATGKSSQNIYRVGDYVYFETSSSSTYAIRRIEELTRVPSSGQNSLEARVMCFMRRSEIPEHLLAQVEKQRNDDTTKHNGDLQPPSGEEDRVPALSNVPTLADVEMTTALVTASASDEQRKLFKQREVFLTRQVETLPATLIRGKCSVTLLSEVESVQSYTDRPDAFFYSLVYDPGQRTLVADRGEIRIGPNYQATLENLVASADENRMDTDSDVHPRPDRLMWSKTDCNETDVDRCLVVAKSVGTYARALDCPAGVREPGLHMAAASASRDVTVQFAHNCIHEASYDFADSIRQMLTSTDPTGFGPVLCRDELEDWSSSEAATFEDCLVRFGKDFDLIKREHLPWKTMRQIIEYFFMWKTTDRYVEHKRAKAAKTEAKVKQVYVPAYVNRSTRMTSQSGEIIVRGKDCDAYPRLAKYSWTEYKKYGHFMPATTYDDSFIMDTSAAQTNGNSSSTDLTASRIVQSRPGLIVQAEPASQNPSSSTPGQHLTSSRVGLTPLKIATLSPDAARNPTNGGSSSASSSSACSNSNLTAAAAATIARNTFFLHTHPMVKALRRLTSVARVRTASRRPHKQLDMNLMRHELNVLLPSLTDTVVAKLNKFTTRRRRPINALLALVQNQKVPPSEPKSVRPAVPAVQPSQPQVVSGGRPKARMANLTRIVQGVVCSAGGRQVMSWTAAPDDIFFIATKPVLALRQTMSANSIRRFARRPTRRLINPNHENKTA